MRGTRFFLASFAFLILLIGISSASITVHSSNLQKSYYSSESISGEVNLTLSEENFTQIVKSNQGDEITLEEFLDWNGAAYVCDPLDCSKGYQSVSNGTSKNVSLSSGGEAYMGFVLRGSNVHVTDLDFDILSNFVEGDALPLKLEFFEDGEWKFSDFSETFSSKYWGCYNPSVASPGALIRTSKYCEMIPIRETGAVKVGATVDDSDTGVLRMNLYPENGGALLGTCEFDPAIDEGCVIEADYGDTISEGDYQVCVGADESTNYKIYSEDGGTNCGFVYSLGPSSSTKDYAVFARAAKYANASELGSSGFDFESLALQADNLLEERYDRDCSGGCFLPIKISGVPQNFQISSVVLGYTVAGENYIENKVSVLRQIPPKVDFSGKLNLRLTGFKAKNSGLYSLSLGSTTLVSENIEILPSPIVTAVSPTNPPAGVPVQFFAAVDFGGQRNTLRYYWDFGDGTTANSTSNNMTHIYSQISNYTLKIRVSSGELSSQKSFLINSISPREAVNATLSFKKTLLDKVEDDIENLPEWYGSEIRKIADIDNFRGELDRLTRARDNAFEDGDFLEIAKDLYQLNIPSEIYSEKTIAIKLVDSEQNLRPEIVASFAGGVNLDYVDDYRIPILNWQSENVASRISSDLFFLRDSNGISKEILRTYDIEVSSEEDYYESYLVIDKPSTEIYFEKDTDYRRVDDATLIVLSPNEKRSFKFYYAGSEPTSFFVSPKLSSLVIEAAIDTGCNYNLVCEEGETYLTCRSDCKPTGWIIFYLIVLFILAILVYTLLQIWYSINYEGHLFRDRRQLYNLLMYISNERARGKSDSEIWKDLRAKKWSGEKLTYAMRKSRGKRTGLPEIIPITKIAAHFRDKGAEKNIVTQAQQQNGRNINKSGPQRL